MEELLLGDARIAIAYLIIGTVSVGAIVAGVVWRRRRKLHKLRQSGVKKYDPLYSKSQPTDA